MDVVFFSFEIKAFVKLYFLIFKQHGVRGIFLVEVRSFFTPFWPRTRILPI